MAVLCCPSSSFPAAVAGSLRSGGSSLLFCRNPPSRSSPRHRWNVISVQGAVPVVPKEEIPSNVENASLPIIYSENGGVSELKTSRNDSTVSITVVGASGDLAKKKIFPALFALYYEDCLPEHFTIFGYARSKMTDAELRTMVSKTLTCRIDKSENCSEKMEQFLKRCFYQSGQYDSMEDFSELGRNLNELEIMLPRVYCQFVLHELLMHKGGRVSNRLFYLSIPPNIFVDVVRCASISASSVHGWTRVIVEKPFGRDSESSAALTRSLKQYPQKIKFLGLITTWGRSLLKTFQFSVSPILYLTSLVKTIHKKCAANIFRGFWH